MPIRSIRTITPEEARKLGIPASVTYIYGVPKRPSKPSPESEIASSPAGVTPASAASEPEAPKAKRRKPGKSE